YGAGVGGSSADQVVRVPTKTRQPLSFDACPLRGAQISPTAFNLILFIVKTFVGVLTFLIFLPLALDASLQLHAPFVQTAGEFSRLLLLTVGLHEVWLLLVLFLVLFLVVFLVFGFPGSSRFSAERSISVTRRRATPRRLATVVIVPTTNPECRQGEEYTPEWFRLHH